MSRARDERFFAAAGQNKHANLRIGGDLVKQRIQIVENFGIEGVQRFGTVDRRDRDVILFFK